MAHRQAPGPRTNEHFDRRARMTVAAAGGLLSVLALAACTPQTGATPSSTPPTPEQTNSSSPTPEAPSPELEAMYAEPVDTFIARPIDQRADLCIDVTKKVISLEEIGDAYADISGNEYDRVQGVATIDDDEQKKVSYVTNMHRLALTRKDPNLAIKIESCLYVDPINSANFATNRQAIEAGGFGSPIELAANSNQLLGREATSWEEPTNGVDANGQETSSQVINTRDSNGATYTGEYVFVPGDSPIYTTDSID